MKYSKLFFVYHIAFNATLYCTDESEWIGHTYDPIYTPAWRRLDDITELSIMEALE